MEDWRAQRISWPWLLTGLSQEPLAHQTCTYTSTEEHRQAGTQTKDSEEEKQAPGLSQKYLSPTILVRN